MMSEAWVATRAMPRKLRDRTGISVCGGKRYISQSHQRDQQNEPPDIAELPRRAFHQSQRRREKKEDQRRQGEEQIKA